jgi:hypothetical protein
MHIIPGEGTDTIKFGMDADRVVALIGEPDSTRPYGDTPGYPRGRVSLAYPGMSILVAPALGVISIDADCDALDVTLWGFRLRNCTSETLMDLLARERVDADRIPADGWGDFRVEALSAGLLLSFCDGTLLGVEVMKPDLRLPGSRG